MSDLGNNSFNKGRPNNTSFSGEDVLKANAPPAPPKNYRSITQQFTSADVLKLKTAQVIERQSIRMQVDPTNPEEPLIPLDQPNYKDAAYYKASITDVRSVSAYSGATQNVFSDYNYEAREG